MKLAPTTPEQRHVIYDDVKLLLKPGFLAQQVTVNGVVFSLRSMVEEDFFLLKYRVPTKSFSEKEWHCWCLASTIWMVDGQLLKSDGDLTYRLYEMCKKLPSMARQDMYSVFLSLMKRVNEATDRVEAFLYEGESRFLWRSQGAYVLEGPLKEVVSGWNPVQKLWSYFNKTEDERNEHDMQWQLATFQVGPHAPKGIKKVESKNKKFHADVERKRQEVMDRVFYESVGLLLKPKDKDKGQKGPWQEIHSAVTPEELKEEMRNWVVGKKDAHDDVVDGIKSKIKFEVEKRREQDEERAREVQKALDDEGFGKNQLQPFVGKAAEDFMSRMRSRVPGTKTVIDDKGHNSAYEKYIRNNPEIGNLKVDESGNLTSDVPVTEDMLEMLKKPKKGELQDQVASRKPTLHFGDDQEE